MANWALTFSAATALLSLLVEAKPHLHHHLKRASTNPSYRLVYSNVQKVPNFGDCIDYTTLDNAGNYSTVAIQCSTEADAATTGAKFFAIYQTTEQKGTDFWWCGWWNAAIVDMADVIESYQENGNAIYKAYGYNFISSATTASTSAKTSLLGTVKASTSTSASVKGTTSSATAKGGTSSAASSASSKSSSATDPKSQPTASSTYSIGGAPSPTSLTGNAPSPATSNESAKSKASSSVSTSVTGVALTSSGDNSSPNPTTLTGKTSPSTGKTSSATPTTTSKAGASSSAQTTGKSSSQLLPAGTTTMTYVATATGIAGFSFVTGAVDAIPSQNIIDYWISDTDLNSQSPETICANHCSSDSSCKSFAVWAQQTWFNCAIYSVATTTSTLQTSNMTTLDDGSISSAIIFNKGKDTNLSLKYSFENPKCGLKGFLWYENAFADSSLDDIDDVVTCASYCKSQSGCLTYEWQPSIQRCQTWNKDMFAAGYLTYDPISTTFWYDAKCDLSKTLSPNFRNTRLTADQKTKYCGIKGDYNSSASGNTYKVYNTATADECGKWCHVYPVFNSYRWSTTDGSCYCQAPSIGLAVVANSASSNVHYAMDCYSKMYYLYTDMTVL
ncbi:hypothetical protein TWF730_005765 [Orbilia blumenaviensis]|uniref:Apple domain-containing protein n=1 Tax=Orbilia blumenaviensis TaxID=1796055 RepID=A0AAV9VKQ6_9PEZI